MFLIFVTVFNIGLGDWVNSFLFYFPTFQVERVLIVCPVTISLNWENEFAKWLPSSSNFKVYGMASQKDKERTCVLRSWLEEGGVLIIGYEMFRILTEEQNERTWEDIRLIKLSLIDPGPQLIICDEGHILKNQHTFARGRRQKKSGGPGTHGRKLFINQHIAFVI